jgi:GH43 family beta-xylosidase
LQATVATIDTTATRWAGNNATTAGLEGGYLGTTWGPCICIDRGRMGEVYTNPVYHRACPDPFVLKHAGEYWAYCTGASPDGRCFPILRSHDLVQWEEVGGAMTPTDLGPHYWAPEVVYRNGDFFLYYGVGDERRMHVRVAVADRPGGPFRDSGRRLTQEEFAIDPHVFEDHDGSRWLFYATDFLEHSHVGTGTVMDRMIDPFTLAGRPRPVTRARYDWQVYDPARAEKGGVRWHTVEGPFVLARKGVYYELFSAGNWKNVSYGVSYATTRRLEAEAEWQQHADGKNVLPILRTIPGRVIGPGHNSVVRGPDNQQLVCVYHRWADDSSARILAVDRLDWVGERLTVLGPSTTPQPTFPPPSVRGFAAPPEGEARLEVGASTFVCEVTTSAADAAHGSHGVGVGELRFAIEPGGVRMHDQERPLPGDFRADVDHLLRLEVNGRRVRFSLDGALARWEGLADAPPSALALFSHGVRARFAAFELTVGWEDSFAHGACEPADLGWETWQAGGNWRAGEGALQCIDAHGGAALVKGPAVDGFEMVVNARIAQGQGSYGVVFASGPDRALLATVEAAGRAWVLRCHGDHPLDVPLPGFDPYVLAQLRFIRRGARIAVWLEDRQVGELYAENGHVRVGVYARGPSVWFETVRLSAAEWAPPVSGR